MGEHVYKLVLCDEPNVEFNIEPWQAEELMSNGAEGLVHLNDELLSRLFSEDCQFIILQSCVPSHGWVECWSLNKDSFAILKGVSLYQFVKMRSGETVIAECKPRPALNLEQINQVFTKLVEHDQKSCGIHAERPIMGADFEMSFNRAEGMLRQLIFDMYELAHAKAKELPTPPEYDLVDYDCDGTWVGDLIVTKKAIAASPRHERVEVRDYLAQGWKRDQLLSHGYCKLKPMQATPPPMTQPHAPAMPTMQQEPQPEPELVIGKLLLDLKDGNLPPTVEPLVQLLANLEGGES